MSTAPQAWESPLARPAGRAAGRLTTASFSGRGALAGLHGDRRGVRQGRGCSASGVAESCLAMRANFRMSAGEARGAIGLKVRLILPAMLGEAGKSSSGVPRDQSGGSWGGRLEQAELPVLPWARVGGAGDVTQRWPESGRPWLAPQTVCPLPSKCSLLGRRVWQDEVRACSTAQVPCCSSIVVGQADHLGASGPGRGWCVGAGAQAEGYGPQEPTGCGPLSRACLVLFPS